MRLAPATLFGLAVGVAVMMVVNGPFNHGGTWPSDARVYFGGLGVFFGSFFGLFAFGIALAIPKREGTQRQKIGLLISALVAGVLSFFVISFNVAWGVPLTSLEGAWLWPLGVIPLLASIALLRRAFRARPSEGSDLASS